MRHEKWLILSVLVAVVLSLGMAYADQNQTGNVSNTAPNAPSAFTPTSTQNSTPTLAWTRGTDDNVDGVRTWWTITLSDNATLIESGVTAFDTQRTSDSVALTQKFYYANNPYTVTMWSEDNSTGDQLNSSATIGTLNIIAPNAPTSPDPANGTAIHDNSYDVSWTSGTTTNPSADLKDDFQWCGTDDTCASPSEVINATTPQTQGSLVQDETYYWQVRTCDYDTGACSAYSEASFTFDNTNDAPAAPGAFTPTSTHNPSQTLSWTRGTDSDLDQVRTWVNLSALTTGSLTSIIDADIAPGNSIQIGAEGSNWQTFALDNDVIMETMRLYLANIGQPITVTVKIYQTSDNTLLAQGSAYADAGGYLNVSIGKFFSANSTYGAYKMTVSTNVTPSADWFYNGDGSSWYYGNGGNEQSGDYVFEIFGYTVSGITPVSLTSTSYGTQGTADSIALSSLPYSKYLVDMWSQDDGVGGTKNSTARIGVLDLFNTQPTAPTGLTASDVWYGVDAILSWTNGTDSDTTPTDTLTHYWQLCSDSGCSTVLDEGYGINSVTKSGLVSATANTTYYWRVLTNDNTGASNENSSWSSIDDFVVFEHQPYYVDSSFVMTDDDGGTLGYQVNPAEATTKTVLMNATFYSAAGFSDLASVTFTITKDGSPYKTVSDVALVNGFAEISFTMPYNDSAGYYNVTVTAQNINGTAQATDHIDAYEYTTLTAYSVPTGDISYGTVIAGANSSVKTMTIANTGNVAFQPRISGTDLIGPVTLLSTTTWYGTVGSQTIQLSNSPQTYSENVPVYDGTPNSDRIDLGWKWAVPVGTPAGSYTGTITIATA